MYQFEEQLKKGGVKLSRRIRNEYAEMVQQAAAKAVYDRKFLPRGESEEFGDVVSRFFLGGHETMSVGEMFVLERGGSLMKEEAEAKKRKNGKVKVKFRRSHVGVIGFEHLTSDDSDELPEAWYDAKNQYLLLRLENTVYLSLHQRSC